MKGIHILAFTFAFTTIHIQNIAAQCSWITGSTETADYSADSWSFAIDEADNYYVAGGFRENFTADGLSFTSSSGVGIFIAKYTSAGDIVWGKVIETHDPSLTFLPKIEYVADHLYIAGSINGSLYESGTTYGDPAKFNFFLGKMTTDGAFDVIHTYRDSLVTSNTYVEGITHDNSNNIYITGRFQGYLFWGPETASSTSSTSFVTKFSSNADFIDFAKTSSPGSFTSRGWAMTADASNNIYFGGYFGKTLSYGSCIDSVTTATGFNPYIIKMDASLNCIWMQIGDGEQVFSPTYSLLTDADNNVYACGNFDDVITWDDVELHSTGGPFFLVKLDPGGDVLWAKNYGKVSSLGGQAATSLSFDSTGNIWMTGWQAETATYGTFTLSGQGVFGVHLDTSGNVLNAIKGKGLAVSYVSKTDNAGHLLIAGASEGDTIGINGAEFYYATDTSKGFFFAKYDACGGDAITGISELQNDIYVYPNPAHDVFTLQLNSDEAAQAELKLYDVTGKLTLTDKADLAQGSNTIEMKVHTIAGYYLLKVITDKKEYRARVLIE